MNALAIASNNNPYSLPLAVPSLDDRAGSPRGVGAVPTLTPEQEYHYAMAYRADPNDLKSAHALVVSHLRVVVSIARKYVGYGLPQADLIQEGSIGLMKAVKRFDPAHGVRLVSFAMHWVKAEIHEYVIKNWRMVKIATTKAQRKLFFNLRSMKTGTNLSHDDVQNIALVLKVKPEEVIEMDQRLTGRDIAIDGGMDNDDDSVAMAPIAYLADDSNEPTAVLARAQKDKLHSEGLESALEILDERSRTIVQSRWLADDEGKGQTLHDLAGTYGVSAERIRQIEAAALKKMRGFLSEQYAA